MIISIDGPASSGKSTAAKKLASKLNFIHFNSGSLYRGITAHLLKQNIDLNNIDENYKLDLIVKYQNNTTRVYVNNIDYSDSLRDNLVSVNTPIISAKKHIRKIVDDCQRDFCSNHNCVIDGRDIGSVVFPNAEYKFYLDCDVHVRAIRRYNELKATNKDVNLDQIERELIERDNFDKTKPIAPLVIPKNAIIIDSTNLTIEQVVDSMLKYIKL